MAQIPYPLINGVRHEWSSVEIKAKGQIFLGCKEISYSDKLEPTKLWGTHPEAIGRTRGVYDASGSVTLYLAEANQLIVLLGAGYKEQSFDIVVAFQEAGLDVITHELIGNRITNDDQSQSQGADGIVTKFDLSIMKIRRNGIESLISPLQGVSA